MPAPEYARNNQINPACSRKTCLERIEEEGLVIVASIINELPISRLGRDAKSCVSTVRPWPKMVDFIAFQTRDSTAQRATTVSHCSYPKPLLRSP